MSTDRLSPSDDARAVANAIDRLADRVEDSDLDQHIHHWRPGPLLTRHIEHGNRIVLVCWCGGIAVQRVPE